MKQLPSILIASALLAASLLFSSSSSLSTSTAEEGAAVYIVFVDEPVGEEPEAFHIRTLAAVLGRSALRIPSDRPMFLCSSVFSSFPGLWFRFRGEDLILFHDAVRSQQGVPSSSITRMRRAGSRRSWRRNRSRNWRVGSVSAVVYFRWCGSNMMFLQPNPWIYKDDRVIKCIWLSV